MGSVHFGDFKTAIAEIQHRPNGAYNDQSEIEVSNKGGDAAHDFSWAVLSGLVDLHCNSSPLSDLSSTEKSNIDGLDDSKTHESLLIYFYGYSKILYQIAHESPLLSRYRALVLWCFGVLYFLFCKKSYFSLDIAKSCDFCGKNSKNYFARNLAIYIFYLVAGLINAIARKVIAIDSACLNFLRQIFAVRIFPFGQSKIDENNFPVRALIFPISDGYSSKFEANRIAGGAQ